VTISLRLLGEVSFDGTPIAGARSADLLAALALHPSGVSDGRLLEDVWTDQVPRAKALQVQVSRVRSQCGPGVVERYDGGYRLGLTDDAVDLWVLEALASTARRALEDDEADRALAAAVAAEEMVRVVTTADGDSPLAEVRRRVCSLGVGVVRTLALASARSGRDAEALPRLGTLHEQDPDDVEVLEALLTAEAATAGAPVALARYESYRRDLADRLGVDPDPALQRLHRALLASDSPVRSGVQYDADDLLGRSADLAGLRSLVRTGRLTTILGPGGLGKTRVAHVLAREATQPRVHFVELVGISSPADVVSEVGSALGVRDSVTGRRTLTPAQQADVRGRIAQELDSAPTLLILDNCEHVLDAVSSLVAFLLVTTRDLRIVTTSRAPLGIAAERVFPLSQLAAADGAELFRRRAHAVRPDAELPDDVVAEIVERLDGLPLALELAAARIRTMTADEVRRALDDRFELLRGRDRSAPARHQTLTAVIGWSWDLLTTEEQRAFAWLSLFQGGFSLDGAGELLGREGPGRVEGLVDQSLLTVVETGGIVRYRMLETVREFGLQRLAESGELDAARDAQTRWAVALADRARPRIFGTGQVEAIDLLDADETNLADVLRRCLVAGDRPAAVSLLAALGGLWAVTGNFGRLVVFSDLTERVLVDWTPPPELEDVTAGALTLMLLFTSFLRPEGVGELGDALRRLPEPRQAWSRVARAIVVSAESSGRLEAVLSLTGDPDRRTARMAWQWAAILSENEGNLEASRDYLDRALALVDEGSTIWEIATLHSQLAMHSLNSGRYDEAAEHARLAAPPLQGLHATDDAFTMRATVALAALRAGRISEAERLLGELGEPPMTDNTSGLVKSQLEGELLLVRGDVEGGLATFDDSLTRMREWRFAGVVSNGLEPWTLTALATALAAHTRFATTAEQRRRRQVLAADTLELLGNLGQVPESAVDFPVTGMALAAVGLWALTQDSPDADPEPGVRLLALARGFGYNRWLTVMAWDELRASADDVAPGRLAAVLEEYGDRRGRELLPEAQRVLATVDAPDVTSSG
jgi:predicted ATPase/DNA-binding SARP family transcriptional activator